MKSVVGVICLIWISKSVVESDKTVDLGELGKNITETITHPSGVIDVLLENIYKYYEALEAIHKEMKKGVKEAENAFYKLRNEGGPPFLKLMPIDEKPLEDFYKWKSYDIIEFRGFLKYNEDEWHDMNELINRTLSAS